MQNTKQPHWQHHTHTKNISLARHTNRSNIKCLCLCNMMRWLSTSSSWEHFTGIKLEKKIKGKLKKSERSVYPLMSLLVCLRLSTCICWRVTSKPACVWSEDSAANVSCLKHYTSTSSTSSSHTFGIHQLLCAVTALIGCIWLVDMVGGNSGG